MRRVLSMKGPLQYSICPDAGTSIITVSTFKPKVGKSERRKNFVRQCYIERFDPNGAMKPRKTLEPTKSAFYSQRITASSANPRLINDRAMHMIWTNYGILTLFPSMSVLSTTGSYLRFATATGWKNGENLRRFLGSTWNCPLFRRGEAQKSGHGCGRSRIYG